MATYFCGRPSPRTDRRCTRPGSDAKLLGGPLRLVCTRHTRLWRRGRTPYTKHTQTEHKETPSAARPRTSLAQAICFVDAVSLVDEVAPAAAFELPPFP